ncbi:mannan-binding protein [Sorangium cellulosum]|uniref:mannan-binding protein n=1 Tax=Sorangium cellulosum TaxID=56 RepID=UPI003D9A4B61
MRIKTLVAGLFAIAGGVFLLGTAMAFDVGAGPIWNNADAQSKCPAVCGSLRWNGQWTTTVPGQMSVCGTVEGLDVPVGPIWNNDDAQTKCPEQLRRVTWSGQWTTTVPGRMSVCGCTPPPPAS